LAALLLALAALATLGGCASAQPGRVPDSLVGFDRTFDAAMGALIDQKMTVTQQDRRHGNIDAKAGNAGIAVSLRTLPDGAIRVSFEPQGDASADPGLLQRVADAYNARMSNLSVLGGFKDSGSQRGGPVPCPSGPAFCP
jgi:hypothetical protein